MAWLRHLEVTDARGCGHPAIPGSSRAAVPSAGHEIRPGRRRRLMRRGMGLNQVVLGDPVGVGDRRPGRLRRASSLCCQVRSMLPASWSAAESSTPSSAGIALGRRDRCERRPACRRCLRSTRAGRGARGSPPGSPRPHPVTQRLWRLPRLDRTQAAMLWSSRWRATDTTWAKLLGRRRDVATFDGDGGQVALPRSAHDGCRRGRWPSPWASAVQCFSDLELVLFEADLGEADHWLG